MRQPRTVHATFLLVALLAATAATGQSRPGGSPAGEQERNSARAAATSEEVARQLTDEQMKGYVQFLRSYQPANAAPGSDPRAAMRAAAEQARLTEQQVAGITLLVREYRSARDGGSAFRARYGDRAADLIARNLPAIDAAAAAGGPSGPPPARRDPGQVNRP